MIYFCLVLLLAAYGSWGGVVLEFFGLTTFFLVVFVILMCFVYLVLRDIWLLCGFVGIGFWLFWFIGKVWLFGYCGRFYDFDCFNVLLFRFNLVALFVSWFWLILLFA